MTPHGSDDITVSLSPSEVTTPTAPARPGTVVAMDEDAQHARVLEERVLAELRDREPIFHRPELGTTRADFEAQTAPDFWEVGASGQTYDREVVWAALADRYANPGDDPWETTGFRCRPLGAEHVPAHLPVAAGRAADKARHHLATYGRRLADRLPPGHDRAGGHRVRVGGLRPGRGDRNGARCDGACGTARSRRSAPSRPAPAGCAARAGPRRRRRRRRAAGGRRSSSPRAASRRTRATPRRSSRAPSACSMVPGLLPHTSCSRSSRTSSTGDRCGGSRRRSASSRKVARSGAW